MKSFIILLAVILLSGCSSIIEQVTKNDATIAKYYGLTEFTDNCKAGIVKCDIDVSADPVSIRKSEVMLKYADEDSEDFKTCYTKTGWLYWSGEKIESSVRTWIKKLVELGVIAQ
jgi:uncharacterized protein YceK